MTPLPLNAAELALLLEVDGGSPVSPEALGLLAVGESLREAVGAGVDVADDVMFTIGLHSALGGGVDVADDVMFTIGLQSAVGGGVDVADDVMRAVAAEAPPAESEMPRWASLGGVAAIFAMAAAALFSIQAGSVGLAPPVELVAEAPAPVLTLARFNDAEVEDIVALEGASVSVMQFDEGGPTIIFVQDSEG